MSAVTKLAKRYPGRWSEATIAGVEAMVRAGLVTPTACFLDKIESVLTTIVNEMISKKEGAL